MEVVDVRVDNVEPISAGEEVELKCTVYGSYPSPVVVWTINNIPISPKNLWVSVK